MASTVIDSLVVKLGLDSSDFKKGSKQATETFNRTKDNAKKTAKNLEEEGKRGAEFFNQLRKSAVLFFSAITAGRGFAEFAKYVVNTGAQLDRMSKNLGVGVETLSRWQGAVRQSGGTAEGALATFQNLSNSLTELKLTGNTGILPYLQALGVAVADANGKALPLDDILKDIGDKLNKLPRQDAYNIGKTLGLDEGTVNLLLKGRGEVEKLLAAQKAYSAADAEAARKAQENWERTKIEIERTTQALIIKLLPAFQKLTESMIKFADVAVPILAKGVDGFNAINEATNGWVLTLGIALVSLKAIGSILGISGGGIIGGLTGLASKLGSFAKLGGALGLFAYSAEAGKGEPDYIADAIKSGKYSGGKSLNQIMADAERANNLPAGTLASIVTQETGDNQDYINDPAKYHYNKDASGKRKSSAFGPFGILDSTAKQPGFGVTPLRDKSLAEQARFAAEYLAARRRASGGDLGKALAGYGEGSKYAMEVMARNGSMSGIYASGATGGNSSISVGEVKIYTNATDANGIAREIKPAIVRQADAGMR